MEKKIIINGLEFDQDSEGNLDITEHIDKISTLIPLLNMLQSNDYEEIFMDFCRNQSIYIFPKVRNQPERSKREDIDCFINCKISMCDSDTLCLNCKKNCKPMMRCSEHERKPREG